MIRIETPDTRTTERDYILDIVLGEFLGLDWQRVPTDRQDTRITLNGHAGEIRMPDVFLSMPEDKWLNAESLPQQPLKIWDSDELGLSVTLVNKKLPVIYGAPDFLSAGQPVNLNPEPATFYFPIDIFGSAFFMLTRYEEVVKQDRDEHDRFPARASLAFQEGFLERPVIDEYVEVLWAIMKQLWPGLNDKSRKFTVKVSHDVDVPSRYGFKNPLKLIRAMGDEVLKVGDFTSALRAPWIRAATKHQLHPKDPANTFDWIMDVSERHGLSSAFYFICGKTTPAKDGDYDAGHPAIRNLMKKIHQRGHTVGLHPSYGAYKRPDLIMREADYLKKISRQEAIVQSKWGGRMHYLRWETPITLRGLEQAGMDYDGTVGYADHVGFRCGTCQEYPAFDLLEREKLRIRIRPLIVMDGTVMARQYLNLGTSDAAYEKIKKLKAACRKVNGCFTLLWHNTELYLPEQRQLYRNTLNML